MEIRSFLDQMNAVLSLMIDAYENKDAAKEDEYQDLEASEEVDDVDDVEVDEDLENEEVSDDYTEDEVVAEVSNILYVYKSLEDSILEVIESSVDDEITFVASDVFISEDSKVNVVIEFTDSEGTSTEEYNF